MLKSTGRIILSVIGIWKMWQFSIPKLMGAERSVHAFNNFGEILPVSGIFFRYFTGIVELTIVAFLVYSLLTRNFRQKIISSFAGNALLLVTMTGAVLIETFFDRSILQRLPLPEQRPINQDIKYPQCQL